MNWEDYLNKIIIFVLIVLMSGFCTSQPDRIAKTTEDGVEVVINRLQPYPIKGEQNRYHLEEIFTVDTEDESTAGLGLTEIWGFDVDSEGSIFIYKPPMSQGDLVFKFAADGTFVRSFATRGEGPGEVPTATYQKINDSDEIWIADAAHSKIMVFDKNGDHITEISIRIWIGAMGNMIQVLPNGNYLIRRSVPRPAGDGLNLVTSLYDSGFEEIKELDQFEIDHPMRVEKFRLPMKLSFWTMTRDGVYIVNEDRGYEIHVYDLRGNLQRKIRKEYQPVSVSGKFKRDIGQKLENTPPALKTKVFFPPHFPPFQCLFADDKGYLYVMTYEQGLSPDGHIVDVFNPDGIYVATMSLEAHLNDPVFTPGGPFDSWITLKRNHLYATREKSSGFTELVVYKVFRE